MKKYIMDHKTVRPIIVLLFAGLILAGCTDLTGDTKVHNRYNVLFIAVDDLRPELGAYGKSYVNTPHIDQLASQGVTFHNHYTMVPTCGPSRYALLTGRSPANSGVTQRNRAFYAGGSALSRDSLKSAQTLPELFRRSGYYTVNIGKISHTPDGKVYAYDGSGDGRPELPNAWDELPTPYGPWEYGWGTFFAYDGGKHREDGQGNRDMMEFVAEEDEDLPDGMMATAAIHKLGELKKRDQPFFLGLGFFKPHLPFVAPERDWEAVQQWDIPPPNHPDPIDSPYWHKSGEFYKYDMSFSKSHPLAREDQMKTRRAYLAATRYVDRQVGRVLDALEEEGLADQTIVVLWSDHGWHLGEFALWGKHTTFERASNSPLIIRSPEMKERGRSSNALVESIDLYPTLIDLAQPSFTKTRYPLDGKSLGPILRNETSQVKERAITYYRDAVSVRTRNYRMIARWDGNAWVDVELYDMTKGPDAVENLADQLPDKVEQMLALVENREKS